MQQIPEEILREASQGDLSSFEAVYKAAAGFVYNIAFRIVGNKEDAEEVTQDVFMILYRKLRRFRFESSFKTWVYRITVNCAINFSRKMPKYKMEEYDDALEVAGCAVGPQAEIDREDRERSVKELLGAISPQQRACVVLREMEGLSYRGIAQVLSVNVNTVRSRLKRARERMLSFRKKVDYGNL